MRRSLGLVAWLVLASLYLTCGWIVGLIVLVILFVRTVFYLRRLRRALAPTIRCPEGHANQQWGRFGCACGAETMSWIWRCPWCGTRYGHVRCSTCQLAVGNPLLGS